MAVIYTTDAYEQHLKNGERRFDREPPTHETFVKGCILDMRVRRAASVIADEMGLTWKRTLTGDDIWELTVAHDTSDIATGRLKSFLLIDLAVEAVDREGNPCWIAAEVSCIVDTRDTTRALDGARLLTRFTGLPARAAVIGLGKDDRILEQIEAGDVFYCEFEEEDINAALNRAGFRALAAGPAGPLPCRLRSRVSGQGRARRPGHLSRVPAIASFCRLHCVRGAAGGDACSHCLCITGV